MSNASDDVVRRNLPEVLLYCDVNDMCSCHECVAWTCECGWCQAEECLNMSRTALGKAVQLRRWSRVRILLQAEADPTAPVCEGRRVVD